MNLVRTISEVRLEIERARSGGLTVSLVPTMGFFHEGHLSLMRLARRESGYVAVSLFVNPTQFGPGEDLEAYPRDLDSDLEQAGREGVDLVFAPEPEEMYEGSASTVVSESRVSSGLCGASRPGHFRGVTTVVAKLFNIFRPDIAVFGRKDLQQLMVIRRMVRDLDFPVEVVAGPIVREPDGLAMSSRNVYLGREERARAPALHRELQRAAGRLAKPGPPVDEVLRECAGEVELQTGGRVEYLTAVDEDMEPAHVRDECRYLAAALHLGKARLIDNVEVAPENP